MYDILGMSVGPPCGHVCSPQWGKPNAPTMTLTSCMVAASAEYRSSFRARMESLMTPTGLEAWK